MPKNAGPICHQTEQPIPLGYHKQQSSAGKRAGALTNKGGRERDRPPRSVRELGMTGAGAGRGWDGWRVGMGVNIPEYTKMNLKALEEEVMTFAPFRKKTCAGGRYINE